MAKVQVQPSLNGPILIRVSEDVELVDHLGNTYDISGREMLALCRCGQSSNRPFCDGTHKSIDFQASEDVSARRER